MASGNYSRTNQNSLWNLPYNVPCTNNQNSQLGWLQSIAPLAQPTFKRQQQAQLAQQAQKRIQRVESNSLTTFPSAGILGPAPSLLPTQQNLLPTTFNTMTLNSSWNMDTDASSHLNSHTNVIVQLVRHKFHANGSLSRYKAQLVANGSSQQLGIDCDETFSPIVKPGTIPTVLSLALTIHWPVHQLDIKNAFLNGEQSETGTLEFGLQLYASSGSFLVAYSDTDWAGCPATRRSTSGYCVFMGENILSWSAKRQHTLSRSSAKAEYRGVANVVAETAWLRNLLRELYTPLLTATLVYCDNVSAVYLSSNPVQHQRTKHVEIDIHFVRDMVDMGHVRVLHVPSRYQYADIFTKGLPSALFEEFCTNLSLCLPSA
ncbi:ribonuclease H-like domain-containing protein [Tanacetum coccineum]